MAWAQIANIRGPTGSTGSVGPPGSTGPPGVGFTWRAAWSSSTAYAINDCVLGSDNQCYVCITANTGNAPPTSGTYWSLMVGAPAADWNTLLNKPATFPPSPHAATHLAAGLTFDFDRRLTVGVPTGALLDFVGEVPPDGFAFCDGTAVNREELAVLFGVIGTAFGEGDGVSTFNLPLRHKRAGFSKIIKT